MSKTYQRCCTEDFCNEPGRMKMDKPECNATNAGTISPVITPNPNAAPKLGDKSKSSPGPVVDQNTVGLQRIEPGNVAKNGAQAHLLSLHSYSLVMFILAIVMRH